MHKVPPAARRDSCRASPRDRQHHLAALTANIYVYIYLPSFRIGNKRYNFYLGFWPVSGRTWPRDPFKRAGLEKWCRTHPKLAQEINYKTISWPFSGPVSIYIYIYIYMSHHFIPPSPPLPPQKFPHEGNPMMRGRMGFCIKSFFVSGGALLIGSRG